MRSLLLTTVLLCAAVAPSRAADGLRLLTAAEARSDVALMRRALETVHPGLYRYTPKSGIDAAFRRLDRAAARPLTDLALYGEIARMLATIHCDHTKAELSDALTRYRETRPTHLPLRFELVEGRMIVVANDGQPGAPPAGSEILAINDVPVPTLLLRLAPTVAFDGSTDHAIAAKLADDSDLMGDDFNEYYPALFGFPEAWSIHWKAIGATAPIRVALRPIDFAAWKRLAGPGAPYRTEFYNGVTWRMSGTTARLRIDTFVNYRNPVQATAFLGGFFRSMQAAGTDHLILDLRANGGGSEDVSVALGRYLIPRPFLWSKPIRYKAIRYGDLVPHFETWGDREARFNPPLAAFTRTTDGWFERTPTLQGATLTDADSTFVQAPVDDAVFRGRLTILSGPRNGSGATRTIAQLKEKAGAVVVGEDSAGSAEGPTSGSIFLLALPASGLKVRVPEAWNRTAIGHWMRGKGVPVDRLVVPTVADLQAGRDRALEVARMAVEPGVDAAAVLQRALAGTWAGTLDYRDFRDDRRVTLPTRLDSDGRRLDWTFDDGPGKTVRESAHWTIDRGGQGLVVAATHVERWRVVEARTASDGAVTFVFDGQAEENGRRVAARTVLTRDGGRLRITRMTHGADEPLLMRHVYELTRVPH